MTDLPARPTPPSITAWLATGALDAELAALLWLLVEAGLRVTVAGPPGSDSGALLAALAAFGPSPVPGPGSRLPAIVEATSFADLRARLAGPPLGASEDELRTLGLVLVLEVAPPGDWRIAAAHYVRPPELDGQGHVQRRPPAILAAWDGRRGAFDDYSWGISAELAGRVGREPSEFEAERARRAGYLADLVAGRVLAPLDVMRAVSGYQAAQRARH